jgi:hypothetical protein
VTDDLRQVHSPHHGAIEHGLYPIRTRLAQEQGK